MSELKSVYIDRTGDWCRSENDTGKFYLKSEADKVIAELEESHKKEVGQLLIEIAEQKSEIERLEILCANYRHDCDNLAISNEQAKRAARTLLKKMNHNKYKRCLAMARYYEEEVRDSIEYMRHCGDGYDAYVNAHIEKMKKRLETWRSLAEKFKTNSTINRKEATNAL